MLLSIFAKRNEAFHLEISLGNVNNSAEDLSRKTSV